MCIVSLVHWSSLVGQTWGTFLSKVPIINGPGKLIPFTLKIEVSLVLHLTFFFFFFLSFASNMMKLSVNETKWSSLLTRTGALILYILI